MEAITHERLVEVFGEDVVLLPPEAVPEELRGQPAGHSLTRTGLPTNLLDALSYASDLEEGVKTYGAHCEEAGIGIESAEPVHAMYRIGYAGGSILLEPGTGDIHYASPETGATLRINTSLDRHIEALCLLEQERERFDFLGEEDVAVQRAELAGLLRAADQDAWGTASLFWHWIIGQISADDCRVC